MLWAVVFGVLSIRRLRSGVLAKVLRLIRINTSLKVECMFCSLLYMQPLKFSTQD
jgi:hypothetical protein